MANRQIINLAALVDETGELRRVFRQQESTWMPHGEYMVLREDGRPLAEITYHQGVAHGPYIDYWSNGEVSLRGHYVDGQRHGSWHFFNKDGTLREVIQFDMDKERIA